MRWSAAVLTGGASRRMGTDKALLVVDGTPMATRVAAALTAAGAADVMCVGGDLEALRALGLDARPDEHPGEGPLGGVLTAQAASTEAVVVVAPCDLLTPLPASFAALVVALAGAPEADGAVPAPDDPLPLAIRRAVRPQLQTRFVAGERSLQRALASLSLVAVPHSAAVDVDRPDDLGRRPRGGQ